MENSEFSGWAKVELMGRNVLVGYVTTKYFGQAALLQVDIPGVEAHEETLVDPEYIEGQWCPSGSVVKRPEIPSASPMVNPASIYRLTACTEEVAKRELNERRPRAIAIVNLPEGYRKRLETDATATDETENDATATDETENDCPDEEDFNHDEEQAESDPVFTS